MSLFQKRGFRYSLAGLFYCFLPVRCRSVGRSAPGAPRASQLLLYDATTAFPSSPLSLCVTRDIQLFFDMCRSRLLALLLSPPSIAPGALTLSLHRRPPRSVGPMVGRSHGGRFLLPFPVHWPRASGPLGGRRDDLERFTSCGN